MKTAEQLAVELKAAQQAYAKRRTADNYYAVDMLTRLYHGAKLRERGSNG